MDRHKREITNHLKVAKNAAIKILSAISYFLVSLRPVYTHQALRVCSYISKGLEEKSKSAPKTEKLKLQKECTLK